MGFEQISKLDDNSGSDSSGVQEADGLSSGDMFETVKISNELLELLIDIADKLKTQVDYRGISSPRLTINIVF